MTISQYRATRPLTDTQLASSVIKAGLLSLYDNRRGLDLCNSGVPLVAH
ncbi:MAG: hypothetical protein R3B91_11060 [Planctomycetaceae bacterium]